MIIGCSRHGTRDSKKYASMYIRWQEESGEWTRIKVKYCALAYTELMAAYRDNSGSELSSSGLGCCRCGDAPSLIVNATYVTSFVPGRQETEFAIPTCDSCTRELREYLRVGSEELPDRGLAVGARNGPNTPDPWADL